MIERCALQYVNPMTDHGEESVNPYHGRWGKETETDFRVAFMSHPGRLGHICSRGPESFDVRQFACIAKVKLALRQSDNC